ncbi:MAG TPA: ABC transporter permease [Acidobacteriaceae bacterium]
MGILRNVASGLRALTHRNERNAEIEEEVRGFVAASVAEKMGRGMSRADAERAARAEVGSAESVRQKVWSAGWESLADSLAQDVRFAVRQIVRSPGFSTVAILSLALGIGANTAIFTLINDVLLKQLPVRDPQQLLSFGDGSSSGEVENSSPGPYDIFPYEFFRRIQNQNEFAGLCAFGSFQALVSVRSGQGAAGPATQAVSDLVSGTFFSVLGAEPLLGRTFRPEDTAVDGKNPVAVISHRYWQQELSADPNVIGRTLTINGTAFTVVGVMRPGFYGVELNQAASGLWLPITMQPQVLMQPTLLNPDGMFWIHIMARSKPGVPTAAAQAWATEQFRRFLVDRAGGQISANRRRQIAGIFIPLLPGGAGISNVRSSFETPLAVLMGMVAIVLLIACANLANLLLAKAAAREREFQARLALGSSRVRIVRQMLTETLVLAFVGGALGLGLAFWVTRGLIHLIVQGATNTALAASPDLRVLAFTFGVCLLTGILFGIAPAWRSARNQAIGTLNAQSRTMTGAGGRGGRLLPRTLVVAQVTLSLVLLMVAGLFLESLNMLRSQDLGFNSSNLLIVPTNPKFAGYQPAQLNALYDRILDRLGTLPGVRSATISGVPPMSGGSWNSPIYIDGRAPDPQQNPQTLLNRVAPRYFETVGIPLLRGRTIGAEDTASAQKAVVVNQKLAEQYFPKGDAIGHTLKIADPGVVGTWQIVGIVGNSKYNTPAEKPQAMAYLAIEQLTGDDQYAYVIQLQTVGDPSKVTDEVRNALAGIDPNLPVVGVSTMADQVDLIIGVPMLVSQLAGFFALLSLALACVGLYGVMSYNVVRRTSEIGIRMALGAPRGRVLWLVLRESLLLLGIGVALGVPAGLAASHGVRAGLFGVSPADPITLALAVLLLTAVICGAAWLPARRATRIDPIVALRYE